VEGVRAVFEIMEIAPVIRDWVAGRTVFKDFLDGRGTAGAGLAEDKEIEAAVFDIQTKIDGRQGPVLSDRPFEQWQLRGCFEGKLGGVTPPAQQVRFEAAIIHVTLPS
jgi:hypothetical protein